MFTKFYRLMGLGAIALTVFSACQREPKAVENNPNYNPDENTVKTKFFLNVSTSSSTKTTAHYAQKDGSFLGMEAVHLLTYNLGTNFNPTAPLDTKDKFIYTPFVGLEALKATKDFDLGSLMSSGDITSTNQSRVLELSLPLNTDAVAIYGKAYKDKNVLADDYQGKVTTEGDPANLMSLKFGMTPRSEQEDVFDGTTFMFARMFNGVITAGLVDEKDYFYNPVTSLYMGTGTEITSPQDRSFHFWWPTGLDKSSATFSDLYYEDDNEYTHYKNGDLLEDGKTLTYQNTVYTYHKGEISWKQLGLAYDLSKKSNVTAEQVNAMLKNFRSGESMGLTFVPLLDVLGDAYSSLTTIVTKDSYEELRSGSAYSIVKTFVDLNSIIAKVKAAKSTSWGENVAKLLAEEISRRIDKFFDSANSQFQPLSTLKTNLQNCTSETDWTNNSANIAKVTADALGSNSSRKGVGGFPENIGLPKGAAILTINKKTTSTEARFIDVFGYIKDLPAYGMGSVKFNIFNYVYPAELMYYANSSIRTNDKSVSEWPTLTSGWVTSGLWSVDNGWTWPGKVESTTTSVGVKYPINYGSALCHSFVKYKDGVTSMLDNRANLFDGETANSIPVVGDDINTGFEVSGILIGGQPAAVGWDYTVWADSYDASAYKFNATSGVFEGLSYNGDRFPKMIYDKVTPQFRIGDTKSTSVNPNNEIYTFCFDNYDPLSKRENQSDVYIALELVNKTGKDFWGELNLVRNEATFYIVGKIDMKSLIDGSGPSTAVTRYTNLITELTNYTSSTTGYHYPPFNPETGATIVVPRVFMQDYETVLNLILDEKALQHAYVTVPDLSASQVSLGLNVDVQWKSGLQFDVEMGKL